MNNTQPAPPELIISRTFRAPRAAVYAAWAQPERMAAWSRFGGSAREFSAFDLHPGGTVHSVQRTPDGREDWDLLTVEEVVPNERLAYVQSFSDASGGVVRHPLSDTWPLRMHTTITFANADDGGTRFTLRWSPVDARPEEAETFAAAADGVRQGWAAMLDGLDAFLAEDEG